MNILKQAQNAANSIFGSKQGKKSRKYRYRVVLMGRQLSKHYTKQAAVSAAAAIKGAKVYKYNPRRKK